MPAMPAVSPFRSSTYRGLNWCFQTHLRKDKKNETTKFDQKTPCQIAFQNLCIQIMVFFLFVLSFFHNNACQDASPRSEKLKARHGSCHLSQIGCGRAPLAQECTLSSKCKPLFGIIFLCHSPVPTYPEVGPSISWSDPTLPDEMRGSIHVLDDTPRTHVKWIWHLDTCPN